VCKLRSDSKYGLQWEVSPEFVRIALRTKALIVPISCVGPDDCFDIVVDSDDMLSAPVLGPEIERRVQRVLHDLRARKWKTGESDLRTDARGILQPVAVPKLPERVYFYAGEIVDPLDRNNAEAYDEKQHVAELYAQVKARVETGIAKLMQVRLPT